MKTTISTEIMLPATGSSISASLVEISMKIAEEYSCLWFLTHKYLQKVKGKTGVYV